MSQHRYSPVLVLVLVLLTVLPAGAQAPEPIELQFLNAAYRDLDSDLDPIHQGRLTIRMSAPEHEITVLGNRIQLDAAADGAVAVTVEVDFEGFGRLLAVITGAGPERRFNDQVTVPRQRLRVSGTVRIQRVADGYLMTVVEAPPVVNVEIRSAIAAKIVRACRALARIPLLGIECSGLEQSLTVVAVPLPQAGEQFLVPAARLSDAERAGFERWLPASD